ncbi:MAG: acyl carrier protein [Lachnospiraceae bacterium]|nr:acyl carrier protein [Lachnospiraceae bacterium]
MRNIKDDLQEVFREVFDDDTIEIAPEMTAADIEDWDSLAHVELIVAVEKAFQTKFTTQEIKGLKNVGDFMDLINKKI